MTGSVNKWIGIGNVGKEPEIRQTQNGEPIANFSLACSESWKDKSTGERKERTEWVRCVVFGSLARVVEAHVHKGDKLYISGKLQTRKWAGQDGVERYSTEVVLQGFNAELVMLGSPKGKDDKPVMDTAEDYRRTKDGGGEAFELNDEIPW